MQRVLPFLEQDNLYEQYESWNGQWVMDTPPALKDAVISVLCCPSDPNSPGFGGGGGRRSNGDGFQGNYVMCAGNTLMTRNSTSLNGMFYRDSKTNFGSLTDGSSNTIMGSESVLRGQSVSGPSGISWGGAGGYWGGGPHGSYGFTTLEAPNSSLPDQIYACKDTNFRMAPCTAVGNGTNLRNFARSYHQGGVQVVMGDGSVRFVSDNVSILTWRAMGSRNQGEVATLP
jgi:prepilin-type processing-associated H-X9-DG protein